MQLRNPFGLPSRREGQPLSAIHSFFLGSGGEVAVSVATGVEVIPLDCIEVPFLNPKLFGDHIGKLIKRRGRNTQRYSPRRAIRGYQPPSLPHLCRQLFQLEAFLGIFPQTFLPLNLPVKTRESHSLDQSSWSSSSPPSCQRTVYKTVGEG